MIGKRNITIERTWSGMVGGWLSRPDYMANEIVARLDELEEVLSRPKADFAAMDHGAAQQIFDRWNRSLIKHTERDTMYAELGHALARLYGAPLAASYSVSPEPVQVAWADNVYLVDRWDVITVPDADVSELKKTGAVTALDELARSRTGHLRLAKMKLSEEITDALATKDAQAVILIECEYPVDWDNPFPGMPLRRLVIFGGNRSEPPKDRFRGMSTSDIETLELVMADFMLEQACMDSLSTMTKLVILSLARTLTKEKALARRADVDGLVAALRAVISRRTLRELNIAYCSAISLEGIKQLAAELAKNDGRLIIGGPTQRQLLNLS